MNFTSFILCVNDIEAMSAWYRDVVGLKQNHNYDEFKGFINLDGFFFNMVKRKYGGNPEHPQINNTMNMGFSVANVEDVDTQYNRLIKAGAKSYKPPEIDGIFKEASVTDPEGNIIYIVAVKE